MPNIPVITDEDDETRKEIQIYTTTLVQSKALDKLTSYYSSWLRLRRAIAWMLRYKQYLITKVRNKKQRSLHESNPGSIQEKQVQHQLTVEDLQKSEREIIRQAQATSFLDVIKALKDDKGKGERTIKAAIKKTGSSVYQLNPMWNPKEGLLRVGGRLVEAPVRESLKHPILLPYKHHVTHLIIEHYHCMVGHMGQESVLSALREKFWIVKGRSAVRQVIKKCINCQRRKKPPANQYMADLPRVRVTPGRPPFTFVGVDYFGPIEVKQRRSRVKRWGCLFTCLTTRAIHIEIAHTLDTDSMINALRRFVSVRGRPEEIRSDQGSNFTKADKELKEALSEVNKDKVCRFCAQTEIRWIFNPPSASHMGGAWERMIRSVRQVLKAMLKEQIVCDEVLFTIIAEVVNIVNSRPLTRNSDSPLDDEPLTPNHLLQLRPCPSLPPGIFSKENCEVKRSWKQAQHIANVFWKRWTREYLPTLLERRKWNVPKPNLKVGDVVLLVDESYSRGNWPLARIVETITGRDGLVRTVRVKTSSTVATRAKKQRKEDLKGKTTVILTRPVTKVCALEMDYPREES